MGNEKTNRYVIEIAVPAVEIYEVVSEIPLTKGEIVSRTEFRKPKEIKYGEAIPTIVVFEGTIEDDAS
tara:strand:+ start:2725 stop:2928 length:204 start_codon:yes stop_codon:yes gene_type:complete